MAQLQVPATTGSDASQRIASSAGSEPTAETAARAPLTTETQPVSPQADAAPAEAKASAELARTDPGSPASSEPRAAFEPALAKPVREIQAPAAQEPGRGDAPRAHSAEQAADLLRQVRLQLAPELRQATIQLQPAALGRLDIKIEVRRGRVRAELAVERRETLETLERHAPELRAALSSVGLEISELALSLADRHNSSEQRAPARQEATAPECASSPGSPAITAALARRIERAGSVDTYA